MADCEAHWPIADSWLTARDILAAYDQKTAIADMELTQQRGLTEYWTPTEAMSPSRRTDIRL